MVEELQDDHVMLKMCPKHTYTHTPTVVIMTCCGDDADKSSVHVFVRFCQKSHEFSECSLEIVFREMCPDSCGRFDH